jgi:hypothetical protein
MMIVVVAIIAAFSLLLSHGQPTFAQDVAPTVDDALPVSFACEATGCLDCLNVGCGWFPAGGENGNGECVDTCSVIADAPCYSDEFYAGKSPQQVCERVNLDEADHNRCSAVTDCTLCINTLKSDGTSPCVWYEITSTCGSGICSFLGCGMSTCPGGGDMSDTESPTPSQSPGNGTDTLVCDGSVTSCNTCLESGCSWAGDQFCLESCDIIADIACYDRTTYPNVTNITDICAMAELNEDDAAICLAQTSCTDCISVPLSITDRSCIWYAVEDDPSSSTCCLACDVPGTPNTTCGTTPPDTNTECDGNVTNCEEDANDSILCGNATDCMNCTMALQSDNVTKCLWYEKANSTIEPYCGQGSSNTSSVEGGNQICDSNGICGISVCSKVNNSMTTNGGKNSSKMDDMATNSTNRESLNVTTTSASAAAATSIFATMTAVIFLFVNFNVLSC